ncbi:MAG: hypothetical protein HOP15_08795, partial [Planctomycetes bacterium]|nr:hypothetical protein [Planctomycetota bacterium]
MNPKSDNSLRSLRAELELALRDSPPSSGPARLPGAGEPPLYDAVVAGKSGEEVVLELSPRVQGAVPLAEFEAVPPPGSPVRVTLVGREEGLWIFSVRAQQQIAAWDQIEVGST